jgi:hypothetical protein
MLEFLDFPFVYATREVIAYIRENLKDLSFLEKCRFFEIFSPGVEQRKIGDFSFKNHPLGLHISLGNMSYIHALHALPGGSSSEGIILCHKNEHEFSCGDLSFSQGEIVDMQGKIQKNTLKFTFDTFYLDKSSIGVAAGYALKDRNELAQNGVITFVLEEDSRSRAIVGHIFIDSRGFVHAHEMMHVHKQVLKGIRHIYENAILANTRIERGDLVQTLRKELTKYCYLLTGRTPVVMPIIIER